MVGGNGSSWAANCSELGVILDTIRTVESGGDYTTPPNGGGAPGAYQYIDSTWGGSGGYESAYLAPPEVQDARAASDVRTVPATYADVAFVPITWYWPRAATDAAQLDIVPLPSEPIAGGARSVFTKFVPIDELMRLVAAEQHCCQFFQFAITVDIRGIALEVRAPADAQSIVQSMFGAAS